MKHPYSYILCELGECENVGKFLSWKKSGKEIEGGGEGHSGRGGGAEGEGRGGRGRSSMLGSSRIL